MSILALAAENESFVAVVGTLTNSTSTAYMDTAFVRSANRILGTSNYFHLIEPFTPASDLWVHFDEAAEPSAGYFPYGLEIGGTLVLRLLIPAVGSMQLQGFKNNAWTNIGPLVTFGLTRDDLHSVDLHVKAQADGVCELFIKGVLIIAESGDFTYLAGINNVRFYGAAGNTSYSGYYSQLIVADEKTIGWKLAVNAATAAGSNSEWSGSFTDINEIGVNDGTVITGQTAGAVSTFARAARTIPDGFKVKELVVLARARLGDATGAQNAQPVIRVGSTNYAGDAFNLTAGYKNHRGSFPLNPATGQAWVNTDAGAAATQFGVKAVA